VRTRAAVFEKKEQTPLPAHDICRGSHPQDFSADVSVFQAHLPSAPPLSRHAKAFGL
jgi:hypothetical protein